MNGSHKIQPTHLATSGRRLPAAVRPQAGPEEPRERHQSASPSRPPARAGLAQGSDRADRRGSGPVRQAGRRGVTAFQRLVADVSLRKVGIIIGNEVSRLSRNCADWHRLLELCAFFDTLIADADGIYNPRDFNDRLLLGLKGTLSEAELHSIRLRLDAGRLSKAGRGELVQHLPTGLVRDANGVRPVRPRSERPGSHPLGLRQIPRTGQRAEGPPLHGDARAEAPPPTDLGPLRRHGALEGAELGGACCRS